MIHLTLSLLLDIRLIPVFLFRRYFTEFMHLSPFPLSGSFPWDKFPAVGIIRSQSVKRVLGSWKVLPVSFQRSNTSFYCHQQCAVVYTFTISLPYSSTWITMWFLRKSRSHWGFSKKPYKNIDPGDFPGGPVGKTTCSQCRGPRFDPWLGN